MWEDQTSRFYFFLSNPTVIKFHFQAHPKVPTVSLMVLKEMKTMCMELRKSICTVTEAIESVLRNRSLAEQEEQSPGTIITILKYLSAMGMVSSTM